MEFLKLWGVVAEHNKSDRKSKRHPTTVLSLDTFTITPL